MKRRAKRGEPIIHSDDIIESNHEGEDDQMYEYLPAFALDKTRLSFG